MMNKVIAAMTPKRTEIPGVTVAPASSLSEEDSALMLRRSRYPDSHWETVMRTKGAHTGMIGSCDWKKLRPASPMKMASTQHASIAAMMNGNRRSPKLGFAAISVVAIARKKCLRRSAASDRDFVLLSSGSIFLHQRPRRPRRAPRLSYAARFSAHALHAG